MRDGTWQCGAALTVILALFSQTARAQDQLPAVQQRAANAANAVAAPKPAETTPETAPPPPAVEAEIQAAEGSCPCGKFFFVGEYLLLEARRSDLDFAVSSGPGGFPIGSVESVNWSGNSGFRVGGGYELPDHWDVGVYYTYYWTDGNRSLGAPAGGTLYASTTLPSGIVSAVDSATAHASLNYNVLDIEFGHWIDAGHSAAVWIGGGGRVAWIDQRFDGTYNGNTAFLATFSSPINFDGGGLRIGAEGDWKLCHGLGFYGRAFGSLLTGDFRTSLLETNNSGASVLVNVSDHFRKVVPVAELGLGIYWQQNNWRALLGYEMTNWFGLVDSPDFAHDFANKLTYRTGDLSLDGLRVGFQYDY
jgi:hypothetical protein